MNMYGGRVFFRDARASCAWSVSANTQLLQVQERFISPTTLWFGLWLDRRLGPSPAPWLFYLPYAASLPVAIHGHQKGRVASRRNHA
jgi:hypothetical protein